MSANKAPENLSLVERFMESKKFCTESARFEYFLRDVLLAQFDEFEKLEREKLHKKEIPKIMREISGDIAKAKIERRRKVTKKFSDLHVTFHLEGNPEQWPKAITKDVFPSMFKDHHQPDLIRYFDRHDWLEHVETWRQVGLWRQIIGRLLKKKGLKLSLERELAPGHMPGGDCILIISW